MKNLLFCLLLCALGLPTACSSDKENGGDEVRLYTTPSSLHFDAEQSVLRLALSTGGRWKITCGAEWLGVEPAEGQGSLKVRVTAQTNPLRQEREASLRIEYGGAVPADIPVFQRAAREEQVTLFASAEDVRDYIGARIAACNYAESLAADGDVLKIGFRDAAMRGIRKGSMPLFTVNDAGYWAADGAATAVKADAEALRAGIPPPVSQTTGGNISIDGADTGVADPGTSPVGLRCVLHTGKFLAFAFSDGGLIQIGSEIDGAFNPPLPAGAESLKILFIGNSFTVDATEHLPGMLRAAGITNIRMVRAYHGGYKLPEFFENYETPDICTYYYCEPGGTKWENDGALNRTLRSIVESDTWDIVTLQEHTGSKYAWEWNAIEREAITGLCDHVRRARPLHRPTICYLMAQAYGRSNTSMYPRYFASQQEMFEAIVAQVRKITAETSIDIVIPSGTSLQNLRTSPLNVDNGMDLTRDSYHMDYGISRYAAAATVFRTLVTPCTGVSVEGNTYRYSNRNTESPYFSTPVTDANTPVAIEAGLAACRSPYTVTDMGKN